ncbi:MAG TPA: class I SAM-dependent methyltransferase [Candidatus Limnocylindrales bacterium]
MPSVTDASLTCPICSSPTDRLFRAHGFWIRGCRSCGHRRAELAPDRAHVDATYDDTYFRDGGAGYPHYLDQSRIVEATGRYYARVASRYMAPGAILDVGAAAGFILRSFVRAGWRGVGLEPNRWMVGYGRERLGLDVRQGTLEEFDTDERFDLVTMIQVLPHLWDLDRALGNAAAVTRPGGYWLIETWDRGSWTARIMGRRWHEYSPPSVLHWFTRDGVERLAAQHGFRAVAHGRPRKRVLGKHAVSLVEHEFRGTPIAGAIHTLRGLAPSEIPYPSEDVFWMLLRKRGGD